MEKDVELAQVWMKLENQETELHHHKQQQQKNSSNSMTIVKRHIS